MASDPLTPQKSLRRKPKQQRSQERVEQLLEAAAEVFWEVGYEAATTHAIAARANTAVGTLYRFFPNKLALFHALEKRHRQGVEDIHAQLMSPEFVRQPIAEIVRQMVETFAQYFESLGPRVVYTQYYTHPELYAQFDEAVDYSYIRRFAIVLRMRNPQMSVPRSELVAETCHRTFNAIFLSALKSEATYQRQLYQELQRLLTSYLKTCDTECHKSSDEDVSRMTAVLVDHKSLNDRQRSAIAHMIEHGQLTIQTFEKLCPQFSRRTLQRDLRQLVDNGILESTGETNQLVYRVVEKPSEKKNRPLDSADE